MQINTEISIGWSEHKDPFIRETAMVYHGTKTNVLCIREYPIIPFFP
jgi:hypothetical protein